MKKFNIVIFKPPGWIHYRVFDEIVESLAASIRDLNHKVAINFNVTDPSAINILFNAHQLTDDMIKDLPKNIIIYNFEQIASDSPHMRPAYFDLLANNGYWDYSLSNMQEMAKLRPNCKPSYVPLGYHKTLTKIKNNKNDIDILFYGSVNPRREKILNHLNSIVGNIKVAFGTYGKERDSLIARSKIVLNLHQHDTHIFEMPRVSYLMANSKVVVSEYHDDTEIADYLKSGIKLCSYSDIVGTCVKLLNDIEEQQSLSNNALNAIMEINYIDILKPILDEL